MAANSGDTNAALMLLIEELRDEIRSVKAGIETKLDKQREEMSEFKEQFGKYSDYFDQNERTTAEFTASMNNMTQKIENVLDQYDTVNKQVGELTSALNESNQMAKENEIEISGCPVEPNINAMDTLKKIGDAIKYPISDLMINDVYRRRAYDPKRPGIVVVSFVRKIDKQNFYKAAWEMKNLSNRSIGIMDGEITKIYVNNSLTFEYKKLLQAAREFRNEFGYRFVWIRGGRILLRKNENSPAIAIRSAMELHNLKKNEKKNGSGGGK